MIQLEGALYSLPKYTWSQSATESLRLRLAHRPLGAIAPDLGTYTLCSKKILP
jgi:hypothetical protein